MATVVPLNASFLSFSVLLADGTTHRPAPADRTTRHKWLTLLRMILSFLLSFLSVQSMGQVCGSLPESSRVTCPPPVRPIRPT